MKFPPDGHPLYKPPYDHTPERRLHWTVKVLLFCGAALVLCKVVPIIAAVVWWVY